MTQEQKDAAIARVERESRNRLIKGLRELADFLEANADVPVPFSYGAAIVATDLDDYDRICGLLDGRPDVGVRSHQVETRHFGPVELRVQIAREKVLDARERQLAEREAQTAVLP